MNEDGIVDSGEIGTTSQRLTERGRLPTLSNDEAWMRLPSGAGATGTPPQLPIWARMLAGPLPLATARMLELDAIHRTGDRLDARLRGQVPLPGGAFRALWNGAGRSAQLPLEPGGDFLF